MERILPSPMSKFVIDSPSEIGYILFAPQGVNDKIFENLADSNQHLREAETAFAISQIEG
jgi:hypothetical protein